MRDIYGILAHPAEHSLSPAMHNAAFKDMEMNGEFQFFDIEPNNLDKFFKKVRKGKIRGLAVSIPYKEKVAKYLDEVDEIAERIGAVNTIFWAGDKLCGTNTDAAGFSKALVEANFSAAGKTALILGIGGASRAVVYALEKMKVKNIYMWARDSKKAQEFIKDFSIKIAPEDISSIHFDFFDLIINATPVGMWPQTGFSILPEKYWRKEQTAFDLVMNPRLTKFLADAKKAGAKIVSGERMLLFQGVRQFEIWHNKKAPIEIMEAALEEKLSNSDVGTNS